MSVIFSNMGDMEGSGRAGRLESLKSLLVERDYTTAAELAAELHVSVRTLHRDLAFLRDLGMPVDSDRGRGGGLRLEHGWSLGRVHLNESEAIGVLLSLAIAEKVGSPLLLGDARAIARKIARSFAPTQAQRIRAVRTRILVGSPASEQMLSTYISPPDAVTRPLLEAFATHRVATIRYENRHATTTDRQVEFHYLYYSVPIWYALVWDRLRDDVRSLRVDRIQDILVMPDRFTSRPEAQFLTAGEPSAKAL